MNHRELETASSIKLVKLPSLHLYLAQNKDLKMHQNYLYFGDKDEMPDKYCKYVIAPYHEITEGFSSVAAQTASNTKQRH